MNIPYIIGGRNLTRYLDMPDSLVPVVPVVPVLPERHTKDDTGGGLGRRRAGQEAAAERAAARGAP